jgi:two-component system sensor histidine kinase ChiS
MDNKKVVRATLAAAISLAAYALVGAEPPPPESFIYREGSGSVALRGPWTVYDGSLDEGSTADATGRRVELSLRPRAPLPDGQDSGARTYRIRILLEGVPPSRRLALCVPAFAGVAAAYANGELLYDSRRDPASSPLLLFDAPGGEASIVLRLASGARGLEQASLFPAFVLFGDADSVDKARLELGVAAAFQDGFFTLLASFVFVLFLFWRKNREFLAFSVYMLVVGLCYFLEDGALFLSHLEATRRGLETARLVGLDLQYLALGFFLATLYRTRIGPAWAAPLYATPGVLAAASLCLPAGLAPVYAAAGLYFAIFGLAALAFLIVLAAKGDEKARWLIPAFLAVPAAAAFGRLGPETVWGAYLIEPAGVAVFAGIVFLMLVKKVAETFESAETLTEYVASVSRAVRRFIPKEFLEHLQKADVIDLRLGDHAKKRMTIFFSDIRAFTELSERLTVEENFAFINSYLSRVVPIIKENGGFVDKYMGDGIMALFPGPEGPDEAIRSAIAMQAKVVEYNGHRANMGYRPISVGVGVHTGDLMLGVVGVEDRMENTVISDAVNLGSRLQAITKAFNIGLAISEQAFKELEDPGIYKYRFIGKVKVKGKAAPVSVFEIFDGIAAELFERKMKANMFFEQGMLSYYQKDFAGAMYFFKRVLAIIPEDGAASFYFDHCMGKATL